MAHVTFIHGIGNKPCEAELGIKWRGVLANRGLDLDAQGVTTSFVYWADLLYPSAVEVRVPGNRYENAADAELSEAPEIGMSWLVAAEGREAVFVKQVSDSIGCSEFASDSPELPGDLPAGGPYERVLLPWFLKRRLMKIFLRDVHHYLFDTEFSPRPGETYHIQREIRARTVKALELADAQPGPHVIVAHSLGSVIAYDCLKRVKNCPSVHGLLTLGSPLGLDEVQDRLRPEWSRDNGFPDGQVTRWVNFYDRLDPVTGLDPVLDNDYCDDGARRIQDVATDNGGLWRHSAEKYLDRDELVNALAGLLNGDSG